MIELPNVTLIAVSSVKIPETISVLKDCAEKIKFDAVKVVTHRKPRKLPESIHYVKCREIIDIDAYNYIVFKELYKYVDTDFALVVQYDSGIVDETLWNNEWLNYDYIGAPWLYRPDAYITPDGEHVRVGNGGFSLRSKKLMELPHIHNIPLTHDKGFYSEDGNICVYHRKQFLELGIKYAPIEVAVHFAFENLMDENYKINPFGYHKNYPNYRWD